MHIKKDLLDKISLILMIILGVLLYVSTFSFAEEAQKTTAVYVKVLGIALFSLSGANLLALFFKREKKDEKFVLTKNPKKFFSFALTLLLYIGLIQGLEKLPLSNAVAFFIASALFIPATSYLLGYKKHIRIGIIISATLGFIWLIFVVLLRVPLP